MIVADLVSSLVWWGAIFSIGLMFVPITYYLFYSYQSLSYTFSKVVGILFLGISVWTLSYLKILSLSSFNLYLVVILWIILNIYLVWKRRVNLKQLSFKSVVLQEALFIVAFLFWGYIKAHEPSIHGLEKFMDFGLINSVLQSDYLPAKDIWLTPFSINYYYFGHFITAFLIKISGVYPAIGYNLMLSSLFAFCLTLSFCIGFNLYEKFETSSLKKSDDFKFKIITGFLAAFLVTLGGNLQTIYAFFQNYVPADNPVPFWQLPLQLNFAGYWYPNATRFIPFTIHEFPLYSFVVADLHGHVLDIPFVLLIIALLIQIFYQQTLRRADYILLGVLISTFLMSNILDGPIYLLVISIIFVLKFNLIQAIKNVALVFVTAIVLFIPFYLHFTPFVSGIGVLCAPKFLTDMGKLGPFIFEVNHCAHSPLWMIVILYGLPIFTTLGFIFFVTRFKKVLNEIDNLSLILVIAAFVLILIPEIIYFKDIYPLHFRANTVFKFGYQAFILLGLATSYMLVRIISTRRSYYVYSTYLLLFILVAIYPFFAVNSYYQSLKDYKGLNGLLYLEDSHPYDYQSILWINQNIKDQPVILEAVGDSYTDYGRISSNTGNPTVLGWPVHEWLWRGSYDPSAVRIEEVKNIYESPDTLNALQLIKKYNIEYIYLGELERQKYTSLNEEKLLRLGDVVFESGKTKIIKVRI